MPVENIYGAAYSLQVQAGGGTQPRVVVWTQETKLYVSSGVSGTRDTVRVCLALGRESWGSSKDLKSK